jgi:hypothetical protein
MTYFLRGLAALPEGGDRAGSDPGLTPGTGADQVCDGPERSARTHPAEEDGSEPLPPFLDGEDGPADGEPDLGYAIAAEGGWSLKGEIAQAATPG